MGDRKVSTPKPANAMKPAPPPAPPTPRRCGHRPGSMLSLVCDREQGHTGDHRGYRAEQDIVVFWPTIRPRVYVAAPYPLKDQATDVARQLRARGYEITSSWLGDSQEDSHEAAALDLADVDRADVLLLLNDPQWATTGTGGRHVEFGYALAKQKRIVVLGRAKANVFHLLHHVEHIDDLEAFQ